jgi:protein-S-isoprenylcysteine O-methyltransferase Ste14
VALVSGVASPTVPLENAQRLNRERLAEFGARATISVLFAVLAVNIGAEFLKTGHVTGLLMLVSELLVVVLTVIRRPAATVDRTVGARIVTGISIVGVLFIRTGGNPVVSDAATATMLALGLAIIVTGKATLGRSFGLMPAHRGIVCRGVYQLVRHPIYAGYLIAHTAFAIAHPMPWNICLFLVSDTALLIRATYEERTLMRDPGYAAYMTHVRWRVAPGLF